MALYKLMGGKLLNEGLSNIIVSLAKGVVNYTFYRYLAISLWSLNVIT